MIKAVEKFKTENSYSWQEYDTIEEAKNSDRRRVLDKYLDQRKPSYEGWSWRDEDKVTGFQKERTRQLKILKEARKDGYEDGYQRGRDEAISRFTEFYPDIMAKLKEIDEQKIEVKNAS